MSWARTMARDYDVAILFGTLDYERYSNVPFDYEVSVIAARGRDGDFRNG